VLTAATAAARRVGAAAGRLLLGPALAVLPRIELHLGVWRDAEYLADHITTQRS
jgi:hypothetical protein